METTRRDALILFAILSLSFFLRSYQLSGIPWWINDEGENLNIAYNLSEGRLQWFAIKYFFIGRPPLFYGVSAVFVKLFGYKMLSLRLVSALSGLATTYLLYLLGGKLQGKRVGFLAAFSYAVIPTFWIWNRSAFVVSFNQMLVTAALLFFVKHVIGGKKDGTYFNLSCFFVALSLITNFLSITFFASLVIATYCYDRKRIGKTFYSLSLLLVFGAVMLATEPYGFTRDFYNAFIFKFRDIISYAPHLSLIAVGFFLLKRHATSSSERVKSLLSENSLYASIAFTTVLASTVAMVLRHKIHPLSVLIPAVTIVLLKHSLSQLSGTRKKILVFAAFLTVVSFLIFYGDNGFYFTLFLGFFGVLLLNEKEASISLLFMLPFTLVLGFIGGGSHKITELYPFFALGVALTIDYLLDGADFTGMARWGRMAVVLTVIAPMLLFTYMDYLMIFEQGVVREDLPEIGRMKKLIQENTDEGEIIVLTAELTSVSEGRKPVFWAQLPAYEGKYPESDIMDNILANPQGMKRDRFLYESRISESSAVILDNKSRALLNKTMSSQVRQLDSWSKEYFGRYVVYINPDK